MVQLKHLSPPFNKPRSLQKKYWRNASFNNASKLSSTELQFQTEIVQSCCSYRSNLVTNFALFNDSKTYNCITSLYRHNSFHVPSVMHLSSVTASTAFEKEELLNSFTQFLIQVDNCPLDSSSLPSSFLISIDFSYEHTFMALTYLDSLKAVGCDGILPFILKHSATAVLYPIHHLFMLYLAQSYLPVV